MQKKMFVCFMFLSSLLCLHAMAKDFKLIRVHAPNSYIKTACGSKYKFTETVLFVEVQIGAKTVWRSEPQSIAGGTKSDFYFFENFTIGDNDNNAVIKILVGEKQAHEQRMRTGTGAAGGAGIGAAIGAIAAGFCSGGLGAPAGAAIGALIGSIGGGGAAYLLPVEGDREVHSFAFHSLYDIQGKHSHDCERGDFLSDGQKIEIEIEGVVHSRH